MMFVKGSSLGVSPGLQRLSKQIEGSAESANLELLRAVDETVDALVHEQKTLRSHLDMALWFLNQIESHEADSIIDSDDEAEVSFARAQASLRHFIDTLRLKKNCAIDDRELNGSHEESVTDAYEETITYAVDLFEMIEQLRMVLSEHDADASTVSDTFSSPEELLASLDEE